MNKREFLIICKDRKFWQWVRNSSPIQYAPISNKDTFLTGIYKSIANRTYYPKPPQEYLTINKGSGVLRVVPALTLEDLCVYYYCARKLEKYIALNRVPGTYGGFGLSGKLRQIEENETQHLQNSLNIAELEDVHYLFMEINGSVTLTSLNPKMWFEEWTDYTHKLYLNCNTYRNGYVAELDISNFYDSVQLDSLEYKLRKYVPPACNDIVYLTLHFLRFWNRHINFYRQQGAGIPQDTFGECSRILANFYLQAYDKHISCYCRSKNAQFFRYADDQIVFADSKEKLEEIIATASSYLMREGLNFNQKKVKIMTVKDFRKYYSFNSFFKLSYKWNDPIDSLVVEQQINYYLRNKSKLKKNGVSLLRRLINISSRMKRRPQNFNLLKSHILNQFLPGNHALTRSDLQKIYGVLSKKEQHKMIVVLNGMVENCWYTEFLFELKFFYRKNKLAYKEVGKRITFLNNFYKFVRK
jgi:hypothetical protein